MPIISPDKHWLNKKEILLIRNIISPQELFLCFIISLQIQINDQLLNRLYIPVILNEGAFLLVKRTIMSQTDLPEVGVALLNEIKELSQLLDSFCTELQRAIVG